MAFERADVIMPDKRRLDALLVERGLAETRSRAQALVLAGRVWSGERRLDKPGHAVPADIPLDLRGADQPYVSRVAAAEALGEIGGREAVRALKRATASPRHNVEEAATRALEKLQGEKQDIQS